MSRSVAKHKGWLVTFAGTGINLALGVLYTWSVIKAAIPAEWGWTAAQKSDPYAVACFVFAVTMIPAGRLQDRIGPRWVATIGGAAVALGCIVAGLAGSSYVGFVVGFGVWAVSVSALVMRRRHRPRSSGFQRPRQA